MKKLTPLIVAILLTASNCIAASMLEGKEVTIPKGTYGWGFLNQLQKSRDAYRSGNDQLARQLLNQNLRQGTIEHFKKRTKATVVDDLGEYVSLKPVGYDMKIWFVRDNILVGNGKKASKSASKVSEKNIKVVTPNNRARLCPEPNCGEGKEITRLPTNATISAKGASTKKGLAVWHNVEYKGKVGWISEFDTNLAGTN